MSQRATLGLDAKRLRLKHRERLVGGLPELGPERKRCKCDDADPLYCSECEEATGACYCKCHEIYRR